MNQHGQQNGTLGLQLSSLSEANLNTITTTTTTTTTIHSSSNDKWINFEVDYDDEMMQNDAPVPAAPLAVVPIEQSHTTETLPVGGPVGTTVAGDDFHRVMHQLEELKEKPLFSEDELEEATEDDDLFDDEDYDLEEVIRRHRQKLEEARQKAGIVDDDDDDYYDDYSAEEDEEEQRRKQAKQPKAGTAPDEGNADNVMQDYLSNIKSKSAPHRFKSKFDDFNDSGDGDLLSGISSSRKLRKNDSIKIISTPNGKVGIVYKVEPKVTDEESARKGTADGTGAGAGPNGGGVAGGAEQRQNKITPVITADGKVALLYRGASDNGDTFRNKYEPITAKDILQLIDNNNNNNSNGGAVNGSNSPASETGSSNTNSSIKNITNNNIYNSHNNYGNSYDSFNRNVNNVIVDSHPPDTGDDSRENNAALGGARSANRLEPVPTVAYPRITTPMSRNSPGNVQHVAPTSITSHIPTTSSGPFGKLDGTLPATAPGAFQPYDRQENSLLINRPLSEVLGIRKNQYLETNTIKIPNSETSTNKMRIGTSNNLLSSLLHNLQQQQHGSAPNATSISADHGEQHRQPEDEQHHRRAGYSVNGFSRSRFYINRRTTPALPPRIIKEESEEDTFIGDGDENALPEVINLAIIPAFEHEIDEKYIRPHHGDWHRRHRHQYNVAPGQPAVHCAMQALVACAVLATFFGIVGTYFKSRVVDHIRVLYW